MSTNPAIEAFKTRLTIAMIPIMSDIRDHLSSNDHESIRTDINTIMQRIRDTQ